MMSQEVYRSPIQEAAALPPEAPHILSVDQTTEAPEGGVTCVIDIDEFEADLRDPDWQDFLRRAVRYRKQLRELGRIR